MEIIEDEWLTLEEVANELKVPKSSIYQMTHKKSIPVHRVGRRLRFNKREVLESFGMGNGAQTVLKNKNFLEKEFIIS